MAYNKFFIHGMITKDLITGEEIMRDGKPLKKAKIEVEQFRINKEEYPKKYEITFYENDIKQIPTNKRLVGANVIVSGTLEGHKKGEEYKVNLKGKRLIINSYLDMEGK